MTQAHIRNSRLHRLGHTSLCKAVTCALLFGIAGQVTAQDSEQDKLGNPDSWKTEEFLADWGLEAINAHHAYARGLTGQGIRMGILDSGVSLEHEDFAGKDHRSIRMADPGCVNESILEGPDACFVSDGDTPQVSVLDYTQADRELVAFLIDYGVLREDVEEILYKYYIGTSFETHGTHVGGTIVANRDGNGSHGVAYGADLTTARLFSNSYSDVTAFLSSVLEYDFGGTSISISPGLEALQDMFAQMAADDVRVVNHSWGFVTEPTNAEEMDALYNEEGYSEYFAVYTDAAIDNDMIQVWAAGNDSGNIAGIHATLPRWIPDAEKYWLSVVNINDTGAIDDSSSICGLSKDWCITAPGTDITSTGIGGDADVDIIYDENGDEIGIEVGERRLQYGFVDLTGTSMAAPHVTGALGLLMERYPYLSNAQVRDVLLTTATDLGDAGVDEVYGWGLVNLEKAIEGYGQFRVDTEVVMNQRHGGTKVWEGDAWDDWTNDIGGPGRLTKSGIGWLRLSGDNSFAGATVKDGVLELDGINTLTSDVQVEGGILQLNGSLDGSNLTVNNGLANINGTVSNNTTLVNGGVLQLDGSLDGSNLTVNSGLANINGIVNNGATLIDGGVLQINANGRLDGSNLTVNNGLANVNGTVSNGATLVAVGGTLGGTGTLGDTTVYGNVAPGNSIGTLTINGNYTQVAGSSYLLELKPPSSNDLLSVTGTATLQGGDVELFLSPGTYLLGQTYNILSAEKGINGSFASIKTGNWNLPFLNFGLHYASNAVALNVVRGARFMSVADTRNQTAVAAALDATADNNALVQNAVLLGNQAQALAAMEQLSGDIYPGLRSALIDSSRMPREAALDRARAASDGFAQQGYESDPNGAWAQAYSSGGHLQGDGNAARINQNSNAILAGYDHQFSHWRIGGFLGNGRTDFSAAGRNAKGHANTNHYGVYGAVTWGGFGLRASWLDAEHDISVQRNIAFGSFNDSTRSNFDGNTRQGVIEAGYRFDQGNWEAEPFLQYADVRMRHDRFNEQGGAAALSGASADTQVGISTAGARFAVNLKGSQQQQTWLSLRGMLGYRKFDGDDNAPQTSLAYAGGPTFIVTGAPLTDDATVAEVGVAARTSAHSLLEVSYSGQFADDSKDDGVNLRYSLQF